MHEVQSALCNDFLFLLQQNDDVSVPPEKVADKSVSGTGCSDGVDLTEPQSSIGAEVSDAEQGKTTGDIILEKDHVESAVQDRKSVV